MAELKFEAGKYYKTSDGHRAFVQSVLLPNPFGPQVTKYPIRGVVDRRWEMSWTEEGRQHYVTESPGDLVEEWREPVVREIVIYLLQDRMEPSRYLTVPQGDYSPIAFRTLGSSKVKVTEGQFAY